MSSWIDDGWRDAEHARRTLRRHGRQRRDVEELISNAFSWRR
jgi:hypothetical protein